MKLNHFGAMIEFASILRGEHPAWAGDSTMNAEAFLRRIATDSPVNAILLAIDLCQRKPEFSKHIGVSLNRIDWCINRLVETIDLSEMMVDVSSGSWCVLYDGRRLHRGDKEECVAIVKRLRG